MSDIVNNPIISDLIKLLPKEKKEIVASVAAVVTGSFALYCFVHSRQSYTGWKQKEATERIPVPKGRTPYFGHLLGLTDSPTRQLAKWQKELGPIMCVDMGVKRWVFLGDPYLAYDIFNINSNATSHRPFQTYTHQYYSKNQGIAFANPSNEWNKTRAAVTRFATAKGVSELNHILEPEADILVQHLINASSKEGQVDILKPLQFAATNVILNVCFGKRATSIYDPLFRCVIANTEEAIAHANFAKDLGTFLPLFSAFDRKSSPAMKRFLEEETFPLYEGLVKEALERDVECLAKDLKQLDHMDERAITVTINDTIAGATDTVGITLAWVLVILCRYQDTQRALRKEIDEFISLHKRLPRFSERNELPLLISVQKECIRYRPASAFGLLHEASEDLVCRGYYIPKGTTLVSNMRAMHMNPNVYEQPEKFIPDRFLDRLKPMAASAHGNVHDRDHFIFGWGRRTCPGAHLAEIELYNILIRLLAKTIIEPVINQEGKAVYPDLDNVKDTGIVVIPKDTVLRVTKRKDALV
ncbi:cytochrome P450 [Fennellomyces sp. T-0311]|nr:cytochrome P450 [Fennellomyces sp. T-0311]